MWELFGDSDRPFRVVTAQTNTDGRVEVFGVAEDDSVWRNVENTPFPAGDDWTGWSPFVTRARQGPPRLAQDQSIPGLRTLAVNSSWLGVMQAFGAAPDGSAWINEQIYDEQTWPTFLRWTGWRPFGVGSRAQTWPFSLWRGWRRPGGGPEGLREVLVPGWTQNAPYVAFGLGFDDTVWISNQIYNPPYLRWSGWRDFGEGSLTLSTLAFCQNDDYRLEVFGIAPDNTVWRNSASLLNLAQWSGWQPFGAPGDRFRAVTAVRVGTDGSECEVFALAPDDTIWRRAPGSNAWVQFGDPADRLTTITSYWEYTHSLHNEVAGTAPDHTIWHAARLPSGQWGPLEPFGSSGDRLQQLTFVWSFFGRMHAFGTDSDGLVWHKAQPEPGTWPPP
jgi:hypothetical protein